MCAPDLALGLSGEPGGRGRFLCSSSPGRGRKDFGGAGKLGGGALPRCACPCPRALCACSPRCWGGRRREQPHRRPRHPARGAGPPGAACGENSLRNGIRDSFRPARSLKAGLQGAVAICCRGCGRQATCGVRAAEFACATRPWPWAKAGQRESGRLLTRRKGPEPLVAAESQAPSCLPYDLCGSLWRVLLNLVLREGNAFAAGPRGPGPCSPRSVRGKHPGPRPGSCVGLSLASSAIGAHPATNRLLPP